MSDFVTLTCPSCGGKLEITNDLDRFACGYCGTEQVVRRSGGVVSLAPVVEGLKQVQVGVDKTASELAIVRLKAEIAELERQLKEVVAQKSSTAAGCLLAVGVVLLIVSLFMFPPLLLLSVPLVVGMVLYFVLKRRKKKRVRLTIEGTITEKKEELAKHEKLVAG